MQDPLQLLPPRANTVWRIVCVQTPGVVVWVEQPIPADVDVLQPAPFNPESARHRGAQRGRFGRSLDEPPHPSRPRRAKAGLGSIRVSAVWQSAVCRGGAWWLADVADVRIHATTGAHPVDRHGEERPMLVPLPESPHAVYEVHYRMVTAEGFISWEGNQYSVPLNRIQPGETIAVKATDSELIVYGRDLTETSRHGLKTW